MVVPEQLLLRYELQIEFNEMNILTVIRREAREAHGHPACIKSGRMERLLIINNDGPWDAFHSIGQ